MKVIDKKEKLYFGVKCKKIPIGKITTPISKNKYLKNSVMSASAIVPQNKININIPNPLNIVFWKNCSNPFIHKNFVIPVDNSKITLYK